MQHPSLHRRTVLAAMASAAILPAGCPLSIPESLPGTMPPSSDHPQRDASQVVELPTLLSRVKDQLDLERRTRGLSIEINGAWQIFHGILAFGDQFEVDTSTGRQPALKYFSKGGSCDGFLPSPGNQFKVADKNDSGSRDQVRYGLNVEIEASTKIGQGHRDQWLAVVAQAGLPIDANWIAQNQSFTVSDWLRQAEFDVPLNYEAEFSWTIIPLAIYRPTSHRWTARDGDTYSTEMLLELEIVRDLEASVCGGTHRLIGIATALQKRKSEGAPMTEVWQKAEDHLNTAVQLAKQNQNPDGSYSTAYMHRTGWCHDLGESLGTTGHVLEFLAMAADDETLRSDWVRRSASKLCDILDQCRNVDLECGVLYHALHGLVEYRRRLTAST